MGHHLSHNLLLGHQNQAGSKVKDLPHPQLIFPLQSISQIIGIRRGSIGLTAPDSRCQTPHSNRRYRPWPLGHAVAMHAPLKAPI